MARSIRFSQRLRRTLAVLALGPAVALVATATPAPATPTAAGTAVTTTVPPRIDTTTAGNWHGVYGSSGYAIVADETKLPAGVSITSPAPPYTFDANPSDGRSLQRASGSGRIAAGLFAADVRTTVTLPAGASYRLAVYVLDYNTVDSRQERATLTDTAGTVLSQVDINKFSAGRWLMWDITGSVVLDLQLTGGANAGYSGIFLDPVGTAGPPPDTTAPTVTADVAGKRAADGSVVEGATVTFPADDGAGYGVDHVSYNADGAPTVVANRPLWVTTPGQHTVTYRAVDLAGNTSPEQAVKFTVSAAPPVPMTALRIIGTNDFHGTLAAAPRQATMVRQLEAGHPGSVLLGVGDDHHWTGYEDDFTGGQFALKSLVQMGMAASAVGNHEFDNGFPELQRLINGGCDPRIGCLDLDGSGTREPWPGTSFPYLGANVRYSDTGEPALPGSVVLNVNGVRVGVIGTVTTSTQPGIGRDLGLTFTDPADATNEEAAKLTAEGVKVIVALVHEGGTADAACNAPGGPIFDIASRISPEVDAIMSGHYHVAYNCTLPDPDNQPRPVIAGTAYGVDLQLVDLKIDPATGDVDRWATVSSVPKIPATTPADPAMTALVAQATKEADRLANVPVAHIDGDIAQLRNAAGTVDTTVENPLTNLVADAQLSYARTNAPGGADLALSYNGIMPGDLTYAKSGAEATDGIVTAHEAWLVELYEPTVLVISMTGRQIESALQQQWISTAPAPRYLMGVSDTVRYVRDPSGTTIPGRVSVDRMTIGGQLVNPGKVYRVAISSILARGIEGVFPAFADATDRYDTGTTTRDALIQYLNRTPVFHPSGLIGRMPTPAEVALNVVTPSLSVSPAPVRAGQVARLAVGVAPARTIPGPVTVRIASDGLSLRGSKACTPIAAGLSCALGSITDPATLAVQAIAGARAVGPHIVTVTVSGPFMPTATASTTVMVAR